MSIIVRDFNGKSININTRGIDSILSLKEKIYSRTKIPINDQLLTLSGKHLEDYKKLSEYNILTNSILNLSMRLKGGVGNYPIFAPGAPNTTQKTATVGSLFSFFVLLTIPNSCLSATVTGLPGTFSKIVVDGTLEITGTPISEDIAVYIIDVTCTNSTVGLDTGGGINNFQFNLEIVNGIPCIVKGQRILTPNGYKLIENIYNGDIITTSQNKDVVALNYKKAFEFTTDITAPYIIPKDSIYPSYPPKDIFLSSDHKIKTNYNWITPKELSKYNPDVRQINIGKPLTYYNIETPNYSTDHLVLEGTTIASFWVKGDTNLINIHDNTL